MLRVVGWILEVGPIHVLAKEKETFVVPPLAAGGVTALGLVLALAGGRNKYEAPVRKNWISLTTLGALIALAPAPARAQAKGPAFDCAKAQGEVEQLVCKDEGLAALDRKLDDVYKAALAKARDAMPQTLRAEQRGWAKGRNDCWKTKDGDPSFLTASWQATGMRECVEGNYKIRISELQATWRLVPAKGPVFFACQGNPANEVVATFFETDPPTASLERGDQTVTAWLVPAGSGSKYEGQNVEFWTKGEEATMTWLGTELKCELK